MKTNKEFLESLYEKKRVHDRIIKRRCRVTVSLALSFCIVPLAMFAFTNVYLDNMDASMGESADYDETIFGEVIVSPESDTIVITGNTICGNLESFACGTSADEVDRQSPTYSATLSSSTTDMVISEDMSPSGTTSVNIAELSEDCRRAIYETYENALLLSEAIFQKCDDLDVCNKVADLISDAEKIVGKSKRNSVTEDDLLTLFTDVNLIYETIAEIYNHLP